jgi:hypothetical protein
MPNDCASGMRFSFDDMLGVVSGSLRSFALLLDEATRSLRAPTWRAFVFATTTFERGAQLL